MPVYKEISTKLLNLWMSNMLSQVLKLKGTLNKDSLCLLIVRLYEYIQCKIKLDLLGVDYKENVKASYSDIKVCDFWNKYSGILNYLYRIRNTICHSNDGSCVDMVLDILGNDMFYSFLSEFGVNGELVVGLMEVSNYFKNQYVLEKKCRSYCLVVLEELREIGGSVFDLRKRLAAKFPKKIVDDCVLTVLNSEQFV